MTEGGVGVIAGAPNQACEARARRSLKEASGTGRNVGAIVSALPQSLIGLPLLGRLQ